MGAQLSLDDAVGASAGGGSGGARISIFISLSDGRRASTGGPVSLATAVRSAPSAAPAAAPRGRKTLGAMGRSVSRALTVSVALKPVPLEYRKQRYWTAAAPPSKELQEETTR